MVSVSQAKKRKRNEIMARIMRHLYQLTHIRQHISIGRTAHIQAHNCALQRRSAASYSLLKLRDQVEQTGPRARNGVAVKWHLTIAAAIEPGRALAQFRSMSMQSEAEKAGQTVKMHRHR